MKRKDLVTGTEYAFSRSTSNSPYATPTRVLLVDADRQIEIRTRRAVEGSMYKTEIVSGFRSAIIARQWLSASPGGRWPGDEAREAGWGNEFEVEPRYLWSTWADYLVRKAIEDTEQVARFEAQEVREAAQQVAIDHLRTLAAPEAFEGLLLEPGTSPRITVEQLTRLLKSARTMALAEADEPFSAEAATDPASVALRAQVKAWERDADKAYRDHEPEPWEA